MPKKPKGVTWDDVRRLAPSLEGTEESTSYGTPAMKVRGKLYARLHQDGENIVLRVPKGDQARLSREKPEVFHFTQHYVGTSYVLLRMVAASADELADALTAAWGEVAE